MKDTFTIVTSVVVGLSLFILGTTLKDPPEETEKETKVELVEPDYYL